MEIKLKKGAKVIFVPAQLRGLVPEEMRTQTGMKPIGRKQIYELPQKLASYLVSSGVATKK